MKERIVSELQSSSWAKPLVYLHSSGFAQTVASQGEREASIPRNRGGPCFKGFVQSLRAERCGKLGGNRGWSGSGAGAFLGCGAGGRRASGLGVLGPSVVVLYNPCGFGWLYGGSTDELNPSGSGSFLSPFTLLGWASAWTWDWFFCSAWLGTAAGGTLPPAGSDWIGSSASYQKDKAWHHIEPCRTGPQNAGGT